MSPLWPIYLCRAMSGNFDFSLAYCFCPRAMIILPSSPSYFAKAIMFLLQAIILCRAIVLLRSYRTRPSPLYSTDKILLSRAICPLYSAQQSRKQTLLWTSHPCPSSQRIGQAHHILPPPRKRVIISSIEPLYSIKTILLSLDYRGFGKATMLC